MGLLSFLRPAPPPPPGPTPAARPFDPATNPYKAKHAWPPDFAKMPLRRQFAYEKRYKRRAKRSFMRPGWVRKVKLAQLLSISAVVGYMVFFAELPEGDPWPFDEIRGWGKRQVDVVRPSQPQPNLGRIETGSEGKA